MGLETVALVVAAVGAATATYGTIQSNHNAKKAAGAQREANDVSAAQQRIQEAEQRRQQIRQQRIRQAQVEQSASNVGASNSSGEIGAVSGIQSNTANNLAFGQSAALAAQGITNQTQRAADFGLRSQMNQGIANIGFSGVNLGMQMGAVDGAMNLFGSNTKKATV